MIVPELSWSALAKISRPSESLSPDATVYVNTSEVEPDPDAYVAYFDDSPANEIRGDPVTVTASENTTVTLTESLVL
jgi:hypothetical protein